MDTIQIEKVDDVWIKVTAIPSIAYELNDYFTFTLPNAKFMPLVQKRVWDGKIRLYSVMNGAIYYGLLKHVIEFAKKKGYQIEYLSEFTSAEFSVQEARDFIKTLNIPEKYEEREYQLNTFVLAVRDKRALLLSPTASGKSLIIYLLARHYNVPTLIIVPTTALVSQLASDFADYGYDSDSLVHKIYSGEEKLTDKPITISTWQSLYKLPKAYFNKFRLVIGDECHLFKAKSLTSIMLKLTNCPYRFGTTGTLDGSLTHKLVLEGLFGGVRKLITTKELQEQGYVAQLTIKCLVLKYDDEIRKQVSKLTYQEELDTIVRLEARNRFITNLATSLPGNTIVFFQFKEKHGYVLHEMIRLKTDRPVYYIDGDIDGDAREKIRVIFDKEKDAIAIVSSGTTSTGTNIKNIHNMIFSSPSKSKIKNLQSIGRGLRLSDTKTSANLYDIADDMSWKKKMNYTLNHFMERVKIYNEEGFSYKIYDIELNTNISRSTVVL